MRRCLYGLMVYMFHSDWNIFTQRRILDIILRSGRHLANQFAGGL